MDFNKHLNLEGKHAPLSASKYQWLGDSDEDVIDRVARSYAAELGTELHDEARKRILYSVKFKKSDRDAVMVNLLEKGLPRFIFDRYDFDSMFTNLMAYTNDAIGFRMTPEVVLRYSDICFGTADAIRFSEKERSLRIHDLKTGSMPVKMEQLMIYNALFCLEYGYKPDKIKTELRIYQSGEITAVEPDSNDISVIMDKIKHFDKLLGGTGL